jgi:hypothetical protein
MIGLQHFSNISDRECEDDFCSIAVNFILKSLKTSVRFKKLIEQRSALTG